MTEWTSGTAITDVPTITIRISGLLSEISDSWETVFDRTETAVGSLSDFVDAWGKLNKRPHCRTRGGEDKYHPGTCGNCGAAL